MSTLDVSKYKIFTLSRPTKYDDEYHMLSVIAENEEKARQIARDFVKNDRGSIRDHSYYADDWLDPKRTSVIEIEDIAPGVVAAWL